MQKDDEIIFMYTRKEAIEDGVLVDLTEWASTREMMGGFRIPVAVTRAVWEMIEAPPGSHEDTRGRAHDVLWMARLAIRRSPDDPERYGFSVLLDRRKVELVIQFHPGDEGEPVATIMLPWED